MKQTLAALIRKTPWLYKAYDKITPQAKVHFKKNDLIFETPNTLSRARVDTFFTKEPKTLEWLDSIPSNETLLDVGANIGIYSLYAANIRKLKKIIAIEPESQNYAQLNKHIYLNSCQDNLTAYNLALSDKTAATTLNLSRFSSGDSHHQVAHNLQSTSNAFKQGILAMSLDELCHQLDFKPNHIKIDVDGHEAAILRGASKTLTSSHLKSVLIESETSATTQEYTQILENFGLKKVAEDLLPNANNGVNLIFKKV